MLLRRTLTELGLRRDPQGMILGQSGGGPGGNHWLEVWYQPTIDLKYRNLVGARSLRAGRGIPSTASCSPDVFLVGASERSMLDLTHWVLARALKDWPSFATIGVPIELSINVPLVALTKLSIFGIMWKKKPAATAVARACSWKISEDEAAGNVDAAPEDDSGVEGPHGIGIAIDTLGPRYSEFLRLSDLPFTTIKIDRSYIAEP